MVILNEADAIYLGDRPASAVYLGDEKVWPFPRNVRVIAGVGRGQTINTTGASVPIDTTGATLLVAALNHWGGTTTTFTDSYGNSWISVPERLFSTGMQIRYAVAPAVGPGHTFTFARTGGYPGLAVAAFSDVPSDTELLLDTGSIAVTTVTSTVGTGTPDRRGALIIYALGHQAPSAIPFFEPASADLARERIANQPWVNGLTMGVVIAWEQQGFTRRPLTGNWRTSGGQTTASTIALST
jgi:hypothetical protein